MAKPPRGTISTISAFHSERRAGTNVRPKARSAMNGLIYLVGLVVVIMAVLSFLGMR